MWLMIRVVPDTEFAGYPEGVVESLHGGLAGDGGDDFQAFI